jgi:hypothetical protein
MGLDEKNRLLYNIIRRFVFSNKVAACLWILDGIFEIIVNRFQKYLTRYHHTIENLQSNIQN